MHRQAMKIPLLGSHQSTGEIEIKLTCMIDLLVYLEFSQSKVVRDWGDGSVKCLHKHRARGPKFNR